MRQEGERRISRALSLNRQRKCQPEWGPLALDRSTDHCSSIKTAGCPECMGTEVARGVSHPGFSGPEGFPGSWDFQCLNLHSQGSQEWLVLLEAGKFVVWVYGSSLLITWSIAKWERASLPLLIHPITKHLCSLNPSVMQCEGYYKEWVAVPVLVELRLVGKTEKSMPMYQADQCGMCVIEHLSHVPHFRNLSSARIDNTQW